MTTARTTRKTLAGRPEATSHAAIEQAAFVLFAERGFDGTTLDHIAEAVGVTRRTLFRYFASKNDIPWGQFDRTLAGFRGMLDAQPADLPLHEAVARGVIAFNDFPADARPHHATRMRLILETPALRAHSALRYAEWRGVVAAYVAERRGEPDHALVPQLLGHLALGIALTAYDQWLRQDRHDADSLLALLRAAGATLDEVYAE
ncbi:mycofactocin system transcriptional regulator [Nocardioides sp.]|uniref:mycofactocin system transcriptional regulator n=1 Tax=Nocardioides sp. TaxID=35761 RepID=UPI002719CDC1|nr:mycofactocin system transcriptional regulator [Nocardioides sp.]MDO9458310.1 mycofactocin system transcriptional regulator [Nocardioides sp.]